MRSTPTRSSRPSCSRDTAIRLSSRPTSSTVWCPSFSPDRSCCTTTPAFISRRKRGSSSKAQAAPGNSCRRTPQISIPLSTVGSASNSKSASNSPSMSVTFIRLLMWCSNRGRYHSGKNYNCSPRLAKRSEFHVEGPGAAVLMGDVPDFLGDGGRRDEKVIGRIRPPLARPLQVDDCVDHHIGDVHPLWSELAGHCFRENALGRLGRRKSGKIRFAAECRGVAGGNNGPFACRNHRWRQSSGEVKQRHGIDLKVAVQHLRIDFQKVPEGTAHRIMDQHCGRTEFGADRFNGSVE